MPSGEGHREPTGPDAPRDDQASPSSAPVARWIWLLEHAQDGVTLAVGVVLLVLAAILLVAGVVDFAHAARPVEEAAQVLLDQVLLVLILVEVVHTVVITLRARRLIAQPFIVIGLIAVIRRILLVLTPVAGSHSVASTSELALLIAMVAVFVGGLIAVGLFEREHRLTPSASIGAASSGC